MTDGVARWGAVALGRPAFDAGRVAQRFGRVHVASAAYDLACALSPRELAWRVRQVRMLQASRRWSASAAACRRAARTNRAAPGDRSALELAWRHGIAATALGDRATADEAFGTAVRLGATSSAWRKAVKAALRQFTHGVRAPAFATLAALEPGERRWAVAEASTYLELSHWPAAATAWEQVVALPGSVPADHYRLGRCYYRLGRENDARAAIATGLALDPTHRPIDDLMLAGTPQAFRSRRLVSHFVEDHLDELRAAVAARPPVEPDRARTAGHVFVFWAQGFDDAPPIVRRCLSQLRELHPPGVVVALDEANLDEWVSVPDDVRAAAGRTPTQYSDLVRSGVLALHGGVWVDATAFATRPLLALPETRTPSGFFAFRYRRYRIASWFMCARPGDPVMAALYELQVLYWRRHDRVVSYFMFHDMLEALCLLDPQVAAVLDEAPIVAPTWELTKRMRTPYDFRRLRTDPREQLRAQAHVQAARGEPRVGHVLRPPARERRGALAGVRRVAGRACRARCRGRGRRRAVPPRSCAAGCRGRSRARRCRAAGRSRRSA